MYKQHSYVGAVTFRVGFQHMLILLHSLTKPLSSSMSQVPAQIQYWVESSSVGTSGV